MAIEDVETFKDNGGEIITVEPFLDEVWVDASWGDERTEPVLLTFTPDQATELAISLLEAAGIARGAQL